MTHQVRIEGSVATKTYVSWSRDEPLREWRALQALATTAPDLAPTPLSLSPGPSVCMTVVPGSLLAGALTEDQLTGLEAALRKLWSLPIDGLLAG
jgi:hypothetical protein